MSRIKGKLYCLTAMLLMISMLAGCGDGAVATGKKADTTEYTVTESVITTEAAAQPGETAAETEISRDNDASGKTAEEGPGMDYKRYLTDDGPLMILDCYYAPAAVPDKSGHDELVLYADKDGLYVTHYILESDDAEETSVSYRADEAAVEEAYSLIEKYGMKEWNDGDYFGGLTGAVYVCKFLCDGELIRCSSEKMPDDGKEALLAVRSVLGGYLTPENLLEE